MTLDADVDPLGKLDKKQRKQVEYIARHQNPLLDPFLKKLARWYGDRCHDEVFVNGKENLYAVLPENSVAATFSNHETFRDFVEQLMEMEKHDKTLPNIAIGENLFSFGSNWFLPSIIPSLILDNFGYKVHREANNRGKDECLAAYEIHELLEGIGIFKYPAGGLTKKGYSPPFAVTSFTTLLQAQLIANRQDNDLERHIFILGSYIRHEMCSEFPTYDKDVEKMRKGNKDMKRVLTLWKQFFAKSKGDTFIGFTPYVSVEGFIDSHPEREYLESVDPYDTRSLLWGNERYQKILTELRDKVFGQVLDAFPLLSPDLVAFSIDSLVKRGIGDKNAVPYSYLENEVKKQYDEAQRLGIPLADNMRNKTARDIIGRSVDLFQTQALPVFDLGPAGVEMRVLLPNTLEKYAARARQSYTHYQKKR